MIGNHQNGILIIHLVCNMSDISHDTSNRATISYRSDVTFKVYQGNSHLYWEIKQLLLLKAQKLTIWIQPNGCLILLLHVFRAFIITQYTLYTFILWSNIYLSQYLMVQRFCNFPIKVLFLIIQHNIWKI